LQKGVVLDRLIDALIATKGVKSADLLIGDLNAVMIAARILGYGKNYTVSMTCPKCGTTSEQTIDLTTLTNTNEPTSSARREMSVVLPLSKAEVVMRLLTRGDEAKIDKEVQALKKVHGDVNKEATTRLKHIIVSVNGDTSKTKIWEFVENMFVQDSRYLREQYKNFLPDVNFDVPVECECGASETARLPIGVNFFWPDARV
jgi:hypothetical protein